MRKGYMYAGAIWSSIVDCQEIELSIFQEEIYKYGLRRIADNPADWKRRTNAFEANLLKEARNQRSRHYREIIIMD